MIARIALAWSRLRDSLWGLPMGMVLAAGLLAAAALRIRLPAGDDPTWWLYSGDAADASTFLANLLTAMITMATLAISITMVVLTLAAQSLGPRLIPIFMGDARTKLALGLFIGTVTYLLVVLRSVFGDLDRVPNLAVSGGTLLVMTSVVVLLFFVHHLARSIVADTVIERVGSSLDASAVALLPESADGEDAKAADRLPENAPAIRAPQSGYVQAIDPDALVAAAADAGAVIDLDIRPGHFVLAGTSLGRIAGGEAGAASAAIADAIVIGRERTAYQDLEYGVRQLVEIALRALSPGVSDPYTACAVIDRIASSLQSIMERGPARRIWKDEDGVVRLYVPSPTFDGIADEAFNQIRQASAGEPAVLIRLAERLVQLLDHAGPDTRPAIARHIGLIAETGRRTIASPADRQALLDRIPAGGPPEPA